MTACKTNQIATVKINGKFGCIDRRGNIIIQPTWDWILNVSMPNQLMVVKDSLYGFINQKGKIIIKPQYLDANPFSEGLAAISNGKKYGFINLGGDTVIPFLYDEIFDGFNNGLCDVTIGDSSGYIDKTGKVIIPIKYRICYPFMSAYAQVHTFKGEVLLVDKRGNTFDYDSISAKHRLWPPRESYPGSFSTSKGQGRISSKGDTVVPPIYKVTGNLINGMYIVQDKSGKWGAYNDKGKLVIQPKFDAMWHFYEGFSNFRINDKWGFVDRSGKIVIDPKFEFAGEFKNGIAYVEYEGKAGFINKKGEFVIQPSFQPNKLNSYFEW